MRKQEILEILGLDDPFHRFTPLPDTQLWGWNGNREILPRLVRVVRPSLIIEVGSWMGLSAATLARSSIAAGLEDTAVICIDTWLGSKEHWRDPALRHCLELENGYPTFYKRFLSNMVLAGVSEKIVPLPMPSAIAASYLKELGIQPDLLYVDGSHDEKDVYDDLMTFWEMLSPDGVMFGDDWPWESVANGVKAFSAEVGVPYQIDDINWIFAKSHKVLVAG